MKTKIIFICIFAIVTSCNKWLDIELEDRVDEKKLYGTATGFYESLAGVYSSMADSLMYGSVMTFQHIDLLGQYYSYASTTSGAYAYLLNFDYENNSVKSVIAGIWSRAYKCIAQVNNILEWTETNHQVLTAVQRDHIRGQAIALRAFLHFDLYRLFSPDVKRSPDALAIPYNKTFGVSTPPMYTVQEVIQLIINDLREAEALLGNVPESANEVYIEPYSCMNLWAVKAMLARAYQARGEYGKAISTAKEVLASSKFRMLQFEDIDKEESELDALFSSEHIFSLRNSKLRDICQRLFRDYVTTGSRTPAPLNFVSYSAICDGNNDDARLAVWFPGSFMKYFYENSDMFYRKMPMIKLSEMYLIVAECSFESDDPDTALAYINLLRDKRVRNNTHLQYISKETILQEMRREYLGEGQMWYAYKRNFAPLPSDSPEGIVPPSDAIFVFPLPDAEIEDGYRNIN